jgi:hypothetical protein
MSVDRGKADIPPQGRDFRFWTHSGHGVTLMQQYRRRVRLSFTRCAKVGGGPAGCAAPAQGLRQPASAMIDLLAPIAAMLASGKPKLLESKWRGALASQSDSALSL